MKKLNLTIYLIEKNQNNLEKIALIYIEDENEFRIYSYKEIFEKIEIVANFCMAKGFQKGDKILLRLPSDPSMIFCFLGCILSGLVPIPISSMLTNKEVEFLVMDSQCKGIFYNKKMTKLDIVPQNSIQIIDTEEIFTIPKLFSFPETYTEDPAFMVYTSGTTGFPKGVIHAQRNILGRIPIQKEWINIQPDDILLHSGELNWTYTLGVGIMDVFSNQATAILVGSIRKDPTLWTKIIKKLNVSIFATVPSLYRRILKYSESSLKNLSSIRHCLSAGEELNLELYKHWTNRIQKPLFEALGMTEISTYISSGYNVPTKMGSPGKPQKGRIIRIIPEDNSSTEEVEVGKVGLIAVHRTDLGLMLQYHNRIEEEKKVYRESWFIGGDLAYRDEEGYYWYMGRNNDIIKSFGYRVSPLEIEKVLNQHPHILESAVCGIHKDDFMILITAFVVKKDNRALTEKEIIQYCKLFLAEYKCPKKVIFLKNLPRNSSGKILKKELKKMYDYKI
ncbi:MAG: acyl-CoA synthetase [Leptonema sp. (in: bacteria)]